MLLVTAGCSQRRNELNENEKENPNPVVQGNVFQNNPKKVVIELIDGRRISGYILDKNGNGDIRFRPYGTMKEVQIKGTQYVKIEESSW